MEIQSANEKFPIIKGSELTDNDYKEEDLLYEKNYICPVCEVEFKAKTVKPKTARVIGYDSDSMPIYKHVNPLHYDVVICPTCGYGATIAYFNCIRGNAKEDIIKNISSHFKNRFFQKTYNTKTALERYKFALISVMYKNDCEELGYTALKIGWIYRMLNDHENEIKFLGHAYANLSKAYTEKPFPICGLGQKELTYLLADLSFRIGNREEALRWLGLVISSRNLEPKLRDKAMELKAAMKQ